MAYREYKKAHTFNGKLLEAAKKLPYEAEAPSYIPYGYEIYTVRQDKNDVLEVVYFIKIPKHIELGRETLVVFLFIEWVIQWKM